MSWRLACAIAAMLSGTTSASAEAGCVRDVVQDVDTKKPIQYGSVMLVGTTMGAMSGSDGTFRLEGVPLGTYRLKAMMMGHLSNEVPIEVTDDPDCGEPVTIMLTPPWPESEAWKRQVVGTDIEVSPSDITIEIRPAKNPFRVGDVPVFDVRMRNVGQKTFLLVGALDDSENGWRYPHVNLEIEGPADGITRESVVGCGYINTLGYDDFRALAPGGSIWPITEPFWPPLDARYGRFAKPGRYKITFRYSSASTDYLDWNGRTTVAPTNEDIADRLRRVPRLDLVDSTFVDVVE